MKKEERFESKFEMEDIEVGMEFLHAETNEKSTVLSKTTNSIEMYNLKSKKQLKKGGLDKEGNEIDRLPGVSCSNYYEISQFNRTFKTL